MKLSASAGAGIAKSAITAPAIPHTQNRIDRCIMAALPDWMCDRFAGNHGQFVFAGPQVNPLRNGLFQPCPNPPDCLTHRTVHMALFNWENDIAQRGTPVPIRETARVIPGMIELPRRKIIAIQTICILSLVMLSLAGQVVRYQFNRPFALGFIDFFYVDLENNLPTWYQSVNFLLAAFLLGMLFRSARRMSERFARHWGLLALGFVYLSLDEMASLHERLINPLQRIIQPSGAWAPTWVIVGLIGAAVAAVYFLPFILHLPHRAKLQAIAAAGLFLGGAIGVEMWTATMFDTTDLNFKNSFRYALMAHAEELLEMIGLLVFIDLLLRLAEQKPPVCIGISGR